MATEIVTLNETQDIETDSIFVGKELDEYLLPVLIISDYVCPKN